MVPQGRGRRRLPRIARQGVHARHAAPLPRPMPSTPRTSPQPPLTLIHERRVPQPDLPLSPREPEARRGEGRGSGRRPKYKNAKRTASQIQIGLKCMRSRAKYQRVTLAPRPAIAAALPEMASQGQGRAARKGRRTLREPHCHRPGTGWQRQSRRVDASETPGLPGWGRGDTP